MKRDSHDGTALAPRREPWATGVKLTTLSSCAGCAAKLAQTALADVLHRLPPIAADPRLLVGANTADDAAVFTLTRDVALVQTVDFFTPIVDDPFAFGQIAATNALSDVYAMGGRPLTALNLLGVPEDTLRPETIASILRGGLRKAQEAGCAVVGGHTIRLPEPVYGMAVTGVVSPRRVIANTGARPGDKLVLTKPLGTGIVTTAIKRGLASPALARRAIASMSTLNAVGAELAEQGLVRAGTDVTGFGLLGHLMNICRGSDVGAEIDAEAVPALAPEVLALVDQDCIPGGSRQNRNTADAWTEWNGVAERRRVLLTDAQTSGGLLLCVAPRQLARVQAWLARAGTLSAAVIGEIFAKEQPQVRIVGARRRTPVKARRAARRERLADVA